MAAGLMSSAVLRWREGYKTVRKLQK